MKPLPTDPESRKRIAELVVALSKLPPDKRKQVMDAERLRRAKFKD